MIIEFSVTNFLSFKEKQTLSMVANGRNSTLESNVIDLPLPGLSGLRLSKAAVLYGANASGKSNLLKAVNFLDWFVENSATSLKPDQPIKVEPFRLSKQTVGQPSEFEVTFVTNGVRYQFGFVVDARRVFSEWLLAYPGGRPQRWYQREINSQTNLYEWDFSQKHFRGAKESLTQQTRPNALFLSTAAQFNHEQLSVVYQWFQQKLKYLDLAQADLEEDAFAAAEAMSEDGSIREQVLDMLRDADLGISSVELEEEDFDLRVLSEVFPNQSSTFYDELMKTLKKKKLAPRRLRWSHHLPNSDDTVSLETESESAGTLRYFSVLGPLLDSMKNGCVLAIDELGANIHPLLVRALLKFFQKAEQAGQGPQLLLTTHDATLLDKEVFRRDQVWFTEKTKEGSTSLYPLSDFHPRKDESLARGYLAGKYGAVPFLVGGLMP